MRTWLSVCLLLGNASIAEAVVRGAWWRASGSCMADGAKESDFETTDR